MIYLIVILALACALVGGFAVSLYVKLQAARTQSTILEQNNHTLADSIVTERTQINAEREQMTAMFRAEREQASNQFTEQFKALAGDILEQKSRSMSATNREGIEALLKPFGEQIEKFRNRIEVESQGRFALQKEVERLADLNLKITREAENLTSALKGNSKIQGDWGEMILQTLLESSGLIRDKHFTVQESLRSETGINLRPDVILSLPESKQIIIDSKVSLSAYVDYTQAEDDTTRKLHLAKHVTSVRKHIEELGQKSYQKLVASPDFSIMFIPNEPAFLIALQNDNSLWHYAYERGVILSSPTNLFAILRIVEDLWRRDTQSRNALEIAIQGGNLYDKFVLLLSSLDSVGRAIQKSEEAFEDAKKHLTGRGNLISRTEKLRRMGVKASKQIPIDLIDTDDDTLQIESEYK